jgi:peptide/nickel transport system substrate-binding protein
VTLQAFDGYFGGEPKIDTVELQVVPEESVEVLALKSGQLDYAVIRDPANISTLMTSKELVANGDPNFTTSVYALVMNNTRKPFDDVRVRRAMIHALDRETLVKQVTEGLITRVANSVLPPTLIGFTDDVPKYSYDPAMAKKLLTEAGYANGIEVTAEGFKVSYNPAMLTVAQGMYKQAGITLNISYLENAALRDHQAKGNYDITVVDLNRAEPDAFMDRYRCELFPPGPNLAMYKGPCEMVTAQAKEVDPAKRVDMLQAIQKQIATDAPIVPLFNTLQLTFAQKHVTGMIPNLSTYQTRFYMFDIQK